MAILAIDLNDAAITMVSERDEPTSVPGCALAAKEGLLFGWEAWSQARLHPRQTLNEYWYELSEEPLRQAAGVVQTSADLVHAQLQQLASYFPTDIDAVIFAVPAYWTAEQLGLLLGIAEELEIPVRGLVDSALAATRREYPDRELLHLEMSLHELTITHILQEGKSTLGDRWRMKNFGVVQMERICAEFIAERFVNSTRFDPLHDAVSEQNLYNNLYEWLSRLSRRSSLSVSIEYGGNEFFAELDKNSLQDRFTEKFSPVMQQMRSSLTAGKSFAIQVDHRLATFPGLLETISQLSQVVAFVLEPAAAARGALYRASQIFGPQAGVSLKTSLQWDQRPIAIEDAPDNARSEEPDTAMLPTHLLFEERAYPLGGQVLNIGTDLSASEYGVRVPDGNGISRRHCSIRVGDHGMEVVDHSRYGTRLNGHVIDGSAILHVGDVLSIGQPGSDFRLIAEVRPEEVARGA